LHAGRVGDVAGGGRGEPLAAEELGCGLEQLVAAVAVVALVFGFAGTAARAFGLGWRGIFSRYGRAGSR